MQNKNYQYIAGLARTLAGTNAENYTDDELVIDMNIVREDMHAKIVAKGKSNPYWDEAVLDIIRTEMDPAGAIVKTQAQLEQANLQIAHNKSEQDRLAQVIKQTEENAKVNQKVIHVLVLNSVMSKNIEYGTTYKELVELIPLAEVGKAYLPHDLITIEDPEHVEVNGEGKRILVQLNKEFTYNGEPVSAFVTNGTLEQNGTGVAWKFEGKE